MKGAKLSRILADPKGRYVFIGGAIYLLEVLVILFAQSMGASSVLAVGISFWIGLIVSFVMQKVVTFGDRRTHHKVLLPQIAAYCLLVLFNFGFTLLFTDVFGSLAPAFILRAAALLITTIWNFYLYKTKIFNHTAKAIY